MTIGKRIKKLREKKNISRKDLSIMLEKSIGQIGHIENDKSDLTCNSIVKLCEILETSSDYLLFGIEREPNNGILDLYNQLTEEYKAVAKHEIKKLLKEQQEEQQQESKGYKKVGNL